MKRSMVVLFSLVLAFNSGCAVNKAANAPRQKDMRILKPGTSRDLILAEYGQPTVTQEENGVKYDIFKFVKGYSGGEKFFHAAGHGVMDVATLGLWEVVGTPTESMAQDNEITIKVIYNSDNTVKEIVPLKDKWQELKKV